MNSVPLLQVDGLWKQFPGVVALEDVSLSIDRGEIVGLVGKNGAGKSTLIKVLAGVVPADAGRMTIDGSDAKLGSPSEATAAQLAFVHQELTEVAHLSVAENVALGLGYPKRGLLVNWGRLRKQTEETLARLGSSLSPTARVGALTAAQQRLVTIARALAQQARLVVLDEPSAQLTSNEIRQLHEVVRALAREGVAVVYVTHRLDEILAVTQRVVVMRDGRVAADRKTASLDRQELVRLIVGAHKELARTRQQRRPDENLSDEVLRVDGLTVAGGPPISFSLHRGEVLGLAGLLGSGRTEIVRAIFGADGRAPGRISVAGRDVTIHSPKDAIRAGIVLLPEDRRREGNFPNFSVRRNLTLATLDQHRLVSWLPAPSQRRERATARREIDRLSIRCRGDNAEMVSLSGGNQQKVLLGRWLGRTAEVMIFDEPNQGVDVEGKEETFEQIEALASAGKGIIVISSDFSELVALCDRVLTVAEGRIVADHHGGAVTESALVEACYSAA